MSKEGKGYLYKRCPYSTASTLYGDEPIPEEEKSVHVTTSGRMVPKSRGWIAGFECQDDECSYYIGSATTELEFVVHGWGGNSLVTGTISIIPGTRFFMRRA